MAIQRTVPGTYQAPVEGIVDYGAFGRGLEKGIAPGLKFLEEQDLEAKKKEKERKARAAGIKEFGVAGGELYGNTFNADKIIQEDYRAEAQRIRSLLLDPNTSDQDKKLLERQWENLSATNASVQLLVDIDNDSELYSQEASNLNDLFVSQGSSIDEFRNAYNKGNARPVVKIIDGISVGGFEITAEDGSKKFLDFQYKINQNTINGSVELRADKRLQTAATGFGKAQGTTVKETDQWVNAGDDTIGTTKRTRLLKQSIDSKISEAETSAAEYVAQNPELMPGLYADLAIDKKFLTDEEKQFINLHGTKYNRFKPEGLSAVMAEIAKENPELTPKQLEQRANTEINNTRDNLLQKYIKNEFLKNTSDFYTQKEDQVMSDGSFRKAGLVYPQDDIFESSTKPVEEKEVKGGFGSTPGLGDASRILAQINFNQSGAPGASLNYFKGIKVKGGEIENPRIVREGENKFLVYDVNTGTTILEAKDNEQRFNLSDTEDRSNLARLKALTLTGADEGTDTTIESLPQAIKLRTDTQDVFGFYSLENRETGITGQSKYASAILSPEWKAWCNKNQKNYASIDKLTKQEQINRSQDILKDFNLSIN